MAFSFFSKSKSGLKEMDGRELSLVMDIESGIVRASLVLFTRETASGPSIPPHIFSTSYMPIEPHGSGSAKLLSAMLIAAGQAAESAAQEGLRLASAHSVNLPVSGIHVIFSSPWIVSKTGTVSVSFEKETEITKARVGAILEQERRALEENFLSAHNSKNTADLVFIEQKIFEIKLNGYPTEHFAGKSALELEVSFAISIGSKNVLNRVEHAVEKAVMTAARKVEYHSSLLLQYAALRNLVSGRSDYIVTHAHHEITDIIVVKGEVCAAIASFPKGTAAFTKGTSILLSQNTGVAHSSLNLQPKNAFHANETERVLSVAKPLADAWANQFATAISSLGPVELMPYRIHLLANEHYAHFEKALLALHVNGSRPFEVIPIEKSVLDAAVSYGDRKGTDSLMSLYVFALR